MYIFLRCVFEYVANVKKPVRGSEAQNIQKNKKVEPQLIFLFTYEKSKCMKTVDKRYFGFRDNGGLV